MKRRFIAFASVSLLFMSCGGPGKADYDTAAQKICDCMKEKSKESAADTLSLNIDMTELDFSICVMDIAADVDPFNEQMGKSIEEKCSDLKPVHDNYVKRSK